MIWTVFLIPVVALICVFTFIAVATWSENRRKEREAYYRSETYQKMLDGSAEAAESVRALIRDEEERRERKRVQGMRMGMRLGGLITMVAGIGLAVFLYYLIDDDPVYLVGLIPILIGLVLTVYGFVMAPPEPGGTGA